MVSEAVLSEYLEEIRKEVCSRCVERPAGGPPCAPLGKVCGVELHLAKLIDSIHHVRSPLIAPYLEHNRHDICSCCAYLHSDACPCPMDTLAVLVVEAVEAVDERRGKRERGKRFVADLWAAASGGDDGIGRAYEAAVGTWTGCDWPTEFGKSGLDLNGWAAADAQAMAVESIGTPEAQDWSAAAEWLAQVEQRACRAEEKAKAAVRAAFAGRWEEALANAQEAWSLEFFTGRPLRRGGGETWRPLCEEVEAAYLGHMGTGRETEPGTASPARFELPME